MKLSLRDAHRLDSRIQHEINVGVPTKDTISIYETFLESQQLTTEWLDGKFNNTSTTLTLITDLISARALIRRIVQMANEQSGINEIISQRLETISIRKVLDEIIHVFISQGGHSITDTILYRKASTLLESTKIQTTEFGCQTDSIRINTINTLLYDHAVNQSRTLMRQLDQIEAKLVGLNANTTIEIDSKLAYFLDCLNLL